MNVSPVVSPDGRHVAFFSSRGLFGIELYLADAETGKIVRKLVTATRDAHYDAVSFINSAGAWSPDGQQLAILVYSDGDNQIHVLDARNGRVVRRIEPKVGAVSGAGSSLQSSCRPAQRVQAEIPFARGGLAGGHWVTSAGATLTM